MAFAFSPQLQSLLDEVVARYSERQAAMLPVLHLVQKANGHHLSLDAMDAVAAYLQVPATRVYEAVTFYTMFRTQPVGRCHLQVCTNPSCALRGADRVVAYLEEKLGVHKGETTPDRRFTLQVECLASCGTGPMMQVNEEYVENLNRESIDEILARHSKD